MNDNDGNIIDLRATVAAKEAAKAAEVTKTAEPTGPNPDKLYAFKMRDGDYAEARGVLMVNGAFFATGIPTSDHQGVDITFAAPIDMVLFVEEITDEVDDAVVA